MGEEFNNLFVELLNNFDTNNRNQYNQNRRNYRYYLSNDGDVNINGNQLWETVRVFLEENDEKAKVKKKPKTLKEEYENREKDEALELTPDSLICMIRNLRDKLTPETIEVIYGVLVTAEMSTCESAT